MKRFFMCGLLLCVAGCGVVEPDTPMQKVVPVKNESRFKIERVGVFEDDLAYGNRRGLYLIKDTKSGKEWLGVSGIGTSELGSHSDGENTVADER